MSAREKIIRATQLAASARTSQQARRVLLEIAEIAEVIGPGAIAKAGMPCPDGYASPAEKLRAAAESGDDNEVLALCQSLAEQFGDMARRWGIAMPSQGQKVARRPSVMAWRRRKTRQLMGVAVGGTLVLVGVLVLALLLQRSLRTSPRMANVKATASGTPTVTVGDSASRSVVAENPRSDPPVAKPAEIPVARQYIPPERGEYRLYFNSIYKKGPFLALPTNVLEREQQTLPGQRVVVGVIASVPRFTTSWSGLSPFALTAKEVELWLRLQLNVSENGPVDLVATVTQDSVELAQVKFTLARKDLTLGGDEGTIQVLVRSPLDHVSIKNGSRLSIAITRPTGPETVSIWGVCSHIEFRDNRSRPDRCQNTYAVRRVASKAADPEIPPLNLSSLTAPAPVIPQSRPQSASTESAPAPAAPTLPADFAFAGLTKVDGPTDIDNVLKGKVTLTIAAGGSELLLSSERDSVRGLHGRGLRIGQRNTGNVLEGTFRLRFIWTPEPFACYRDRRLLGIWDPGRNKLRMPEADEAPAILPEENDKGSKDDHQRENQESANEKRENEWGVWTRADGQNRTEARFLKFQDSKVHLEKRDGSVVRVSMNALSKGDQEYVRNTLRLRRAEQTKKGIREGVR